MAVDSKNKRVSAANLPFMTLYPEPDSDITSIDRIMAAGEYLIHPWVSATSYNDSSGWTNPEYAYDDNLGNFAVETVHSDLEILELEWDAGIRTDMIRIYAHDVDIIAGTHDATGVKIEVWKDSEWCSYGSFTLPEDEWFEYPLGKSIIGDRVRITSLDQEEYLYIAGVQFLNLSAFAPDTVIPKTSFGLICNPRIGGSLAR